MRRDRPVAAPTWYLVRFVRSSCAAVAGNGAALEQRGGAAVSRPSPATERPGRPARRRSAEVAAGRGLRKGGVELVATDVDVEHVDGGSDGVVAVLADHGETASLHRGARRQEFDLLVLEH